MNCLALFRRFAPLFVVSVLLLPALHAQATAGEHAPPATAPKGEPPNYDIVSIKPSKDNRSGHIDITINDDLFSARDASIRTLLAQAYTINRDLIYGIPKWALSAHFDIQAKMLNPDRMALHSLTREQRGALLQPMLAERFQLKVHTETRILPIYDLVAVKDGPRFKAAVHHEGSTGIGVHNQLMTATDTSMDALATELSFFVHRPVLDQTGLKGKYDFTCDWISPRAPNSSEEDSEASLLTALQEQLGLKLRSAKGPVVTLIVDHVEPPSPD